MNYSIKSQNFKQHVDLSELKNLPVGCYHVFNAFGDFVKNHNIIISSEAIYLLTSFNQRTDNDLLEELKDINPLIEEINTSGHPADYEIWVENTTEEEY